MSEKVFDSDFANRRSLLSLFFRLLGLFLWRMGGIRQVVFIGEPETGEKIRKSANAGSIANENPERMA